MHVVEHHIRLNKNNDPIQHLVLAKIHSRSWCIERGASTDGFKIRHFQTGTLYAVKRAFHQFWRLSASMFDYQKSTLPSHFYPTFLNISMKTSF